VKDEDILRLMRAAADRAAAMSDAATLEAADFAFLGAPAGNPGEPTIQSIDDYIRTTLERWEGKLDITEIAGRLGLSRKTLWEKKKRIGP